WSAPTFAEGFGASTVARFASEGGKALAERSANSEKNAIATPAPPIHVSATLLNCSVPQPISFAASHQSPSALFSGTKKSPPTNQWPAPTRLKIAKPA